MDPGTLAHFPHRVADLARLVEIGEVLNSSVELDEILDMILIGVTAGQGLAFNRAFLLLIDEHESTLRCRHAIGPENPEEAEHDWIELENKRLTLREMMMNSRDAQRGVGRQGAKILELLRVPLADTNHVLVRALQPDGGSRVVRSVECDSLSCEMISANLGVDQFALVPIHSRGGPVGVLVADNAITRRPIDDGDLELLRLFAGHAGTAIEKARLYMKIVEEKNELEKVHKELRDNQQTIITLQRLSDLGEMTAQMAHEIRNPLVSIGGFSRRLLSETAVGDPRRRQLQIIVNEVVRLETILAEVLDFARPLTPRLAPTDLNNLVRETLESLSPEREGLGIELTLELDDTIGDVPIDSSLFRIALINVLRNALQAIPRKGSRAGRITVRSQSNGAVVEVAVIDNGTGIAGEAAERIFDPFFTTKPSGSGLGLAIVAQILKEHRGQVRFESRAGEGAAFFMDLPLQKGNTP